MRDTYSTVAYNGCSCVDSPDELPDSTTRKGGFEPGQFGGPTSHLFEDAAVEVTIDGRSAFMEVTVYECDECDECIIVADAESTDYTDCPHDMDEVEWGDDLKHFDNRRALEGDCPCGLTYYKTFEYAGTLRDDGSVVQEPRYAWE